MTAIRERPPAHVGTAFGVRVEDAEPLADGDAWRADGVVLRPVVDRACEVWLGRTLIDVPGIRVARPLGTTDGRQIVAGWVAYRTVEDGKPASVDDKVAVSIKLHDALADVPRPPFLSKQNDVVARADRMAWGETPPRLPGARGGRWFEILAGSVKTVPLPDQVVHGDLYRGVRLGDDGVPTVFGFRPFYRPAEWATALVVVDALIAGAGDAELITRWSHLPAWRQMLLRAMLFRLAAHALAEPADDDAIDNLRRAASLVSEFA